MKKIFRIISFIFFVTSAMVASDVTLNIIEQPNFATYHPFLIELNALMLEEYQVSPALFYPLEFLMFSQWYNSSNRIFLEVQLSGQAIGYALCQMTSDTTVYICQFALNSADYSLDLITDVLMQLFALMPQLTQVSALCPSVFTDLTSLLLELGFVLNPNMDVSVPSVYSQYDLQVPSKCLMCEILYGNDFWEMPENDGNLDQSGYAMPDEPAEAFEVVDEK